MHHVRSRRSRLVRPLAVASFALCLLTCGWLAESAETTLPTDPAQRKSFQELVSRARDYFVPTEELWTSRKAFIEQLTRVAGAGHAPLADPTFLRWLVDQSRAFEPPMDDTKWVRLNEYTLKQQGSAGFELKSPSLWVHVRTPATYPSKARDLEKYERPDPWPLVYSMHGKDKAGDDAGKHIVSTRWSKDVAPDIQKDWFVVVPIAAAAAYSEGGRTRVERTIAPLRKVCESYHVDYDRVILDGGQDALVLLSSAPWLFAGAILREGVLDTPKLKASVVNYHHTPLFVIDQPDLAKALRDGGHPSVTEGTAAESIPWMAKQRRTDPKSFSWVIRESDQQLAWYVNLDQPYWEDDVREIRVEAVDSEEHPNTLRIDAKGIAEVSVFLSDTILSLDKKVRIVINGILVREEELKLDPSLAAVRRDLDGMFQARGRVNPIDVRRSKYYGWLRSGFYLRIPVPAPTVAASESNGEPAAPAPVTSGATEEQEVQTSRLLERAKSVISDDPDRARDLLLRICRDFPTTSSHAEALALLKQLGVTDADALGQGR